MLNIKKHVWLLLLLVFTVAAAGMCTGCDKKSTTTVRLNEVVHSIFYAPQYVALEKGFFAEEGIAIELSVGQGADSRVS